MRMSRLLSLRIAALSSVVLVAAVALATWQAHGDVEDETRAARQIGLLLDALGALQDAPPDAVSQRLRALEDTLRDGHLRHLRVRIREAGGRELAANPPPPASRLEDWLLPRFAAALPAPAAAATHWDLRTRDGRRFEVAMQVDPSSEQREALAGLLEMFGVLVLFGALVLLAGYLTLRQVLAPLRGILHAIDGYRHQDYRRRAPLGRSDELNAVAGALNHLADELADAQEARRVLSARLLTLQEDERAHIARELHDEFGQVLTAMRADAAWLARQVRDRPDLSAVAEELRSHCERASLDVRNLLQRLRPPAQGDGDAVPLRRMLEALVAGWQARPGLDLRVRLAFELDEDPPQPLALALYRISQEALTNAARHARAGEVRVRLCRDAAGALHWEASDDGVGLATPATESGEGNGLAGMRERVWAHGGEIVFEPARPGATRPGLRIRARFARPRASAAG
ncbi:sensor histidine kinase [Coralloluteibacterium stylophorae]|uniref:HAMP domain-containing protein n=1 Tax=Coralloluteibacterium stylophorae TaxID=1776034 RepID=A0A8J8AX10_9GAMM|nr:histidine kinase [Coralloluteibacterium stylophorae]MBS7458446.1 hypothetical protein [Coralloluteibacterium stylophorae]